MRGGGRRGGREDLNQLSQMCVYDGSSVATGLAGKRRVCKRGKMVDSGKRSDK